MSEHKAEPADLPQLPLLELGEWVLKHPAKSYYPDEGDVNWGEPAKMGATHAGIDLVAELAPEVIEKFLGPVGWAIAAYETLGFLNEVFEANELPERRREAQLAAWNAYLWENYWTNETMYQSREAREAAFDRVAGDNASHGIVPPLTQEAEAKRQELINHINQRWLDDMKAITELKHYVETGEGGIRLNAPGGGSDVYLMVTPFEGAKDHPDRLVSTGEAQHELELYEGAMAADMKTVTDFDTNPANWDLTPEQRAMTSLSCDMPAAGQCEATPAPDASEEELYRTIGGRPY